MCAARRSSTLESHGGAGHVFGPLSVLLFQESRILDCYSSAATAFESGGAFGVSSGRLVLTDSVIARCSAADTGGALGVYAGTIELTRSRIEACSAPKSAGGVYISGSTAEFIATDSSFDLCTSGGSGGALGGALAIVEGRARITGGGSQHCSSDGSAGAMYVTGAGQLEVRNHHFASCSSKVNGGVLYVQGADANALLDGCTMVDVGGPTQSCNGTAAKFAPRSCHGAPWLRSLWRLSRGSGRSLIPGAASDRSEHPRWPHKLIKRRPSDPDAS